MISLRRTLQALLLAACMAATGIASHASAAISGDCDDDCPWDSSGYLSSCNEDDVGGIWCDYSDGHYYYSLGGSC